MRPSASLSGQDSRLPALGDPHPEPSPHQEALCPCHTRSPALQARPRPCKAQQTPSPSASARERASWAQHREQIRDTGAQGRLRTFSTLPSQGAGQLQVRLCGPCFTRTQFSPLQPLPACSTPKPRPEPSLTPKARSWGCSSPGPPRPGCPPPPPRACLPAGGAARGPGEPREGTEAEAGAANSPGGFM